MTVEAAALLEGRVRRPCDFIMRGRPQKRIEEQHCTTVADRDVLGAEPFVRWAVVSQRDEIPQADVP